MSQIQRKSNFEVLRIVALLLIIFFHMSDHGGVPFGSGTLFDDVYFQLLAFGGRVGVWIFVMVSGYFLVNKTFKFRKMVKLMGECLFYNILVVLFIFLFGIRVLNHHEIIQACLPFGTYNWFASCYIVFYMFFPFVTQDIPSTTFALFINWISSVVFNSNFCKYCDALDSNLGFSDSYFHICL